MAMHAGKLREGSFGSLTSAASATAVDISDLVDVDAYVAGTFVGTWKVEVSHDGGTTYSTFDTDTAPKKLATLPRCGTLRLTCSAYTSGTIKGLFGGSDINR